MCMEMQLVQQSICLFPLHKKAAQLTPPKAKSPFCKTDLAASQQLPSFVA